MPHLDHNKVSMKKRIAQEARYYPDYKKRPFIPVKKSKLKKSYRGYTTIKVSQKEQLTKLVRKIKARYEVANNSFGAGMALDIGKKAKAYGKLSSKQLAWIAKSSCSLSIRISSRIEELFYQFCPICRQLE